MKQRRSFSPSRILTGLSAAGLGLLPSLAAAHPGHYHPPGEDDEFDALTAGFLHPLTGMDHLILAVAAGYLAFSWKAGKARFACFTFIASLAIGAWTGLGIQAGTALEIALALTLIAAGAAFFGTRNLKPGFFITAVASVGFIHGFAHASEAAPGLARLEYSGGFIASTALLLGIGGLLQSATTRFSRPLLPRIAGFALFVLGSASLIQAL